MAYSSRAFLAVARVRTIAGEKRRSALRKKASPDDDVLEPLPIYEDGVAIEPVMAAPEVHAIDARTFARGCVEAVGLLLEERTEIRAQAPWTPIQLPVQSTWRSSRFLSTFSRMVGLNPGRLGSLPEWWRASARGQRLEVTNRLVLEEPRYGAHGAWRMRGRLRTAWLRSSIPVELLLWPHLGSWTKMTLEPQRRVFCGRRYFRTGHRALDALTDQLMGQLNAPPR